MKTDMIERLRKLEAAMFQPATKWDLVARLGYSCERTLTRDIAMLQKLGGKVIVTDNGNQHWTYKTVRAKAVFRHG